MTQEQPCPHNTSIEPIRSSGKRPSSRNGLRNFFLFVGLLTATGIFGSAAYAQATVYNAIPSPLAPNYGSVGYQANQTAQFGDFVHLGGTNRVLNTVTVTMSDWALESTPANVAYCSANPGTCSPVGFLHPFTLNIYNIGTGAPGVRQVGSVVATVTQTKLVPWRPAADPTCPGGTAWRAPDNNCYNGYAFNLSFDMSSLGATLPDDVVVGIAYNTQTYGTSPMVADGPYNSLNVSAVGVPSFGTDDNANNVFWNTLTAGNYSDGGAAGVGVFREDTNWGPGFGNFGTIPSRSQPRQPQLSLSMTTWHVREQLSRRSMPPSPLHLQMPLFRFVRVPIQKTSLSTNRW